MIVILLFEGKKLLFRISETVRASAKNVWKSFADFDSYHRMVSIRKIVLRDLDLLFQRQKSYILIYLTRYELSQKCVEDFCRLRHLPSNVVIAKIALCDLYLLFEYKQLYL